jgi:hypothetical protein
MLINLSADEIKILTQLLENCISDLREEISKTDNIGYKQMLKERRDVLTKLLNILVNAKESQPLNI